MRWRRGWVILGVIGCFVWARGVQAAAQAPAEATVGKVSINTVSALSIPEPLLARVEASVLKVTERITLGRPVSLVQTRTTEYESVIKEVFAKVLVGYKLEELSLLAGEETQIILRLAPDGPLIERVELVVDARQLEPAGVDAIRRDFAAGEEDYAAVFRGLPQLALDWAAPILLAHLEELLGGDFPGFGLSVTAEGKDPLRLTAVLAATGQLVEEVDVAINSATIPRLMTALWRKKAREQFAYLRGMPIAYLRRSQTKWEDYAATALNGDPALSFLQLNWEVRLIPGGLTQARFQVESAIYDVDAGAFLVITNPAVVGAELSAGVRTFADLELSAKLVLDTSGTNLGGSLVYDLNQETRLGLTYESRGQKGLLWLSYSSGRGDLFILSADVFTGKAYATIGLTVGGGFGVKLTVDSTRSYQFVLEFGL